MRKLGQCTVFSSWLKEVASVAVARFWPCLSQFGLADMGASQRAHWSLGTYG